MEKLAASDSSVYRQIFESNPLPMWVFDANTLQFLDVNASALALSGYQREELLSMRVTDIREGSQVQRAGERRTALRDNPQYWQYRLKDGRVREMQVSTRNIRFGGRRARLAVVLDVTERRSLEDQLRQSQKMEAVGMLAGGIAHDFNNLLTIITGYSQLLLASVPAGDPNHTSAEQIMRAGERAAALTRQLLAFSRRQAVQPKVLDLNALVSSMGVMLQRLIGEDVELRLALGSDLGRVNADPGQIEQVVMNLAVNSRDAMPHGGALTIETSNAEIPENYGSGQMAVAAGSYVALSVMDTGSGMDDETRSRVFEPFFTTKGLGKGTGLGLSTVYSIVKRSGGSLELTSEPGMGTRVTAYLPRIDQPAVLESEKSDAITKRGSETILVVEDEEMVRTLVRQTLERAGYRILEAADPSAARRICESYAGPIQLLVSDVVLPKQGGPQLANELLELRPKMKVLFMSGYAEQSAAQGLAKAERAFLPKPFTPAALTRKVREVLEDDGNGLRTRGAGA